MDCFKQDALCPFFDAIPRFKEEFERMAKYSPQDILRIVEENQVRFIRLQFTDIFGAMKCVNVTASQHLQQVLARGDVDALHGAEDIGELQADKAHLVLPPRCAGCPAANT